MARPERGQLRGREQAGGRRSKTGEEGRAQITVKTEEWLQVITERVLQWSRRHEA